ncbi:hypothetical protein L596_009309 [Steinernema carpocapsae]|uniref:Uncharacterized protein n=1 Tax=Steinernema carpocapsae TaxID=34508 RepID=A0A4U5PG95_STECR|nr:hypothetical protein L596_009309 [Steinernema carpocapsae]
MSAFDVLEWVSSPNESLPRPVFPPLPLPFSPLGALLRAVRPRLAVVLARGEPENHRRMPERPDPAEQVRQRESYALHLQLLQDEFQQNPDGHGTPSRRRWSAARSTSRAPPCRSASGGTSSATPTRRRGAAKRNGISSSKFAPAAVRAPAASAPLPTPLSSFQASFCSSGYSSRRPGCCT